MMAPMTVAFFGASTGCGLAALKEILAAGHECIALCRTPSKLTDLLPASTNANLLVIKGNAHNKAAVSQCLRRQDGRLVDAVVFTIGGRFIMSKMAFDDNNVCEKGINTVLEALVDLRQAGAAGGPHIIGVSTTGMSKFGRDVPIALIPLYHVALKVPHADKRIMEDNLAASGESFTVVRASLLVDGATSKTIRVGIEDPQHGIESKAIGYTISREDAGRWIANNLVLDRNDAYVNKTVTVTY